MNQNLFVMVTRTKVTPPIPQNGVPQTSRLLQVQDADVKITFSPWAGKEKNAVTLFITATVALVFAVFAF